MNVTHAVEEPRAQQNLRRTVPRRVKKGTPKPCQAPRANSDSRIPQSTYAHAFHTNPDGSTHQNRNTTSLPVPHPYTSNQALGSVLGLDPRRPGEQGMKAGRGRGGGREVKGGASVEVGGSLTSRCVAQAQNLQRFFITSSMIASPKYFPHSHPSKLNISNNTNDLFCVQCPTMADMRQINRSAVIRTIKNEIRTTVVSGDLMAPIRRSVASRKLIYTP